MNKTENPLLSGIFDDRPQTSTIEVAFPTLGQFYHDGVMAPGTDFLSIGVKPISLVTEMVLRDPIMLASGRAIPRMIRELVPQVLIPEELADIDIEVILIASRIASYGPVISIDHICGNPEKKEDGELVCGKTNPMRVDLLEHIQKFAPIQDWSLYRIEFPIVDTPQRKTTQIVHLRRIPYKAVLSGIRNSIQIEHDIEPFKEKNLEELLLNDEALNVYERMTEVISAKSVDNLLDSIISVEFVQTVDGATNTSMVYLNQNPEWIKEWLWKIPKEWLDQLSDRVKEIAKELADKNVIDYTCPSCKFKNRVPLELDLNKLFFSDTPPNEPKEKALPVSTGKSRSKSRVRSKISSR